jgi:archaemetzincin
MGVILLGPVGEVAGHVVAANIQVILEVPVDLLGRDEVPAHTFQFQRQQYDAGLILKYLAELNFPHFARIIAVTNVDLCTPILTHVFGEAELGGRVAVVSDCRLRHNYDGSFAPLDRYYERLAKVAVHEVAHTLSVYHCNDAKCVMRYSPKVQHLDEVGLYFCERCEFMVRKSLGHIRSTVDI